MDNIETFTPMAPNLPVKFKDMGDGSYAPVYYVLTDRPVQTINGYIQSLVFDDSVRSAIEKQTLVLEEILSILKEGK